MYRRRTVLDKYSLIRKAEIRGAARIRGFMKKIAKKYGVSESILEPSISQVITSGSDYLIVWELPASTWQNYPEYDRAFKELAKEFNATVREQETYRGKHIKKFFSVPHEVVWEKFGIKSGE